MDVSFGLKFCHLPYGQTAFQFTCMVDKRLKMANKESPLFILFMLFYYFFRLPLTFFWQSLPCAGHKLKGPLLLLL